MSSKKIIQMILLNLAIIFSSIALFSKAFLGLSLITGTVFSICAAWISLATCVGVFFKGNLALLKKKETHLLTQNIQSLKDCIYVFEEAIQNGDVFDENITKNIDQIRRFTRKKETIKDILLQKFAATEISYQKFNGVLNEIENVMYLNMRSILNKISAFDIDEYETMQRRGFANTSISKEKMEIYNEYINYVEDATRVNEEILLKLDKILLEISKYNTIDGGDIIRLPAVIEMDELIKNAKLYK